MATAESAAELAVPESRAGLSPRHLFIIYFVLGILLSLLALYFLVQRQQRIEFESQMETIQRTTHGLAKHVGASLKNILEQSPPEQASAAAQDLMNRYLNIDDLFNIRLIQEDATIVAALKKPQVGGKEDWDVALRALKGQPGSGMLVKANTRVFCVAVPIIFGSRTWAMVLYRNLEPLHKTIAASQQNILWSSVGTFTGLLLVVSGLVWFAAYKVRQAREIEAQNARLAMMGTMAAGVAHEVRSPLNALALNLDYLKRLAQKQSAAEPFTGEVVENLNTAQHQIARMEGLVRDFTQLAKPLSIQAEPVRLDAAIDEVLKLFSSTATERRIQLEKELATDAAAVNADRLRLEQVLINLIKNAFEATPEGGAIRIKTYTQPASKQLVLEIHDSGQGISAEQQAVLFEPYQTTKSHGLGLGLYLSKRIVEAHQGKLSVSSEAGQGATFQIALPLAA